MKKELTPEQIEAKRAYFKEYQRRYRETEAYKTYRSSDSFKESKRKSGKIYMSKPKNRDRHNSYMRERQRIARAAKRNEKSL